jgi:hypothetical protein
MEHPLICHDFRECRFIGVGDMGIETVKFISSNELNLFVDVFNQKKFSDESMPNYPNASFIMDQQVDSMLFVFCIADIDDDVSYRIVKNFSMSFTPNEFSYKDPHSVGIFKCSKGVENVKEFTSIFDTVVYVDDNDLRQFGNNYKELLSRPIWTLLNMCLSLGLCIDSADVKSSLRNVSLAKVSSNFIEFNSDTQRDIILSSPLQKDAFTFSFLEFDSKCTGEEVFDYIGFNLIDRISLDVADTSLDNRRLINFWWSSQCKMHKVGMVHSL